MAVFNPEIRPHDNQFLQYSRGASPDRSFEALFSGAANIVEGAAKTADTHIQTGIRRDVQAGQDAINDAFGVDSATAVSSEKVGSEQAIPGEVATAKSHMELLTKAWVSGDLRESHYFGKLNDMAKRLRHKYPGYRDQIDSIVQDVTGVNPANSLRNALFSEMEALKNAEDTDKFNRENWVKENERYLDPDYLSRWDAGDKSPELFHEMRMNAHGRKRKEEETQSFRASLDLQVLQNNVNKDAVSSHATQKASDIIFTRMSVANRAAAGGSSFQAMQQRARDFQLSGGTIDPAEKGQLVDMARDLALSMREEFLAYMNEPSAEGNSLAGANPKAVEEGLKLIDDQMATIDYYLNNEKYGILQIDALRTQAIKEGATRELLEQNPIFPVLSAMTGITGGADWVSAFGLRDTGIGTAVHEYMTKKLNMEAYAGKTADGGPAPTFDEVIKKMDETGVSDPKAYRFTVDEIGKNILDKNVSPEILDNTVEAMYGEKNNGFLANFVKTDHGRIRTFNKVANPAITERMWEIGKTNPEHWQKYKRWVMDNFTNTIFDQKAADLNDLFDKVQDYGDLVYVEETNKFEIDTHIEGKAGVGRLGTSLENDLADKEVRATAMKSALDDLNSYLTLLTPILEKENEDVYTAVEQLMGEAGFDIIPDDDSTEDNLAPEPETLSDELGEVVGAETRDEILNMIGAAEGASYNTLFGGGEENLTGRSVAEVMELQSGLDNTPVGKYQIIDTTLQSLVADGTLDPSEPFDEEAQDRAARALLRRRGYERFKAGKMSKKDFLKALSQEWASVPSSVGGESFYAGDGLNKATAAGKALAKEL